MTAAKIRVIITAEFDDAGQIKNYHSNWGVNPADAVITADMRRVFRAQVLADVASEERIEDASTEKPHIEIINERREES